VSGALASLNEHLKLDFLGRLATRCRSTGDLRTPEAVFFGDSQTIDASGRILKRYAAGPLQHERLLRHGHDVFSLGLCSCARAASSVWQFPTGAHCKGRRLLLRIAVAA
jgi:hypothetical protein